MQAAYRPPESGVVESLYSTALERLLLPLGDRLLRTEFMSTLSRWRVLQHSSAAQLDHLQQTGLQQLLGYATSSVPYYRDLGVEPDADPRTWLERFPLLTKHQLVARTDDLVVGNRDELIASPSSGSSGVQSTVYMTRAEHSRTQAYQTLLWEWSGFRLGRSLLQTGMTPERGVVKRIKDALLRTTYVDAFGISDERAKSILASRSGTDGHFGGYASSLYLFARAAARDGRHDVAFDSVISWGDKMFPEYRELVESTFSTRVFDTYGSTEGLVIAGQRDLDSYYVLTPHVVVELLDDHGRPVPVGSVGRVVVTRLDSRAMPLIRFAIGDLAVAGRRPADAELKFPVLDRIVGRDTDIVETPGGRHLIVHTFTGIFEFFEEIEQFRVVQREPTGIDIEYIPRSGFTTAVLSQIEARLRDIIGEPFQIRFVRVDHIPSSPSGKPQIVSSHLPKG